MQQTIEQAVEAHKAGKLDEAEALYRAILKDQPQHPDANHNLGILAVSLNNSVAALPLLKTALEANPKQGQYWISYIGALIKDNQFENARLVLEQGKKMGLAGEKVDALEDRVRSILGNLESQGSEQNPLKMAIQFREEGKYQEAQEWLNSFLASNPNSAEAWSLLSQVLLLNKQEIASEKAIETAALVNPELPSVYRNQARLLLKQVKPKEALQKASSAYDRSREDPESLLVLAACLAANNRDKEALSLIEKSLQERPNYAEAFANRALLRFKGKDLTGAIKDLELALSFKPHLSHIWGFLGSVRYQKNDLSGAIQALQKVREIEPTNVSNMVSLGELFRQSNDNRIAIEIFERAVELEPENAKAWTNIGVTWQQFGGMEKAKHAYEKSLAINPKSAEVSNNLGAIEKDAGNWESARAYFEKATEISPDFSQAYSNLGVTLQELGRLEEAEASHRQAIALKPDFAQFHSNFGNTLRDLGRIEEAEASYRQAIAFKPDFAEAHSNLGITLKDLGRLEEALNSVVASLKIKPTANAKNLFASISMYIAPKSWDAALSEMVISALLAPWARPSSVMGVACRLLKLDAGFMRVLNQTNGHATQSPDASLLDSFVANPLESSSLLHALLSSSQIADHELEWLFTRLRRNLLMQVTPNMSDELEDNDVPALYCYLAQQCFINEYVYFETAEEIEHLQLLLVRLKTAIKREEEISASLVIAVACYAPLYSVLGAQSLPQRHWPLDVVSVLKQQIQEPLEELALRVSIPSLTSTENAVSLEVQRMYEENPYPRWVRLPKEASEHTLNARLRSLFPSGAFRALVDDRSPEILVAGCGTGQHPIGTAQGIKGANVLAIDLSMASLSYAKRKTAELGIENIEYAQADLLKLRSLGRTFDVIESAGVLHHLENPFEGWEVLLSLLKPHGLMKLGFYSEIARRDIVKVRNMIAKEGIGSSAQDIRAYRKQLLELKDSDGLGFGTTRGDFFSTSSCRDLLFHVQEHRMTLPVLSNFFKENDLSFLGFDIDSSVKRSYKSRFPNDLSATDLKNWHIYEEENPDTFRSMYQFWIQKNS